MSRARLLKKHGKMGNRGVRKEPAGMPALQAMHEVVGARAALAPVVVDIGVNRRDGMCTRATVEFRAASANEAARTVEAVLTTEAPVRVWGPYGGGQIDEVLLVSGARHADRVVLLDSHNRWSTEDIRGTVSGIKREESKDEEPARMPALLSGMLAFDDDDASMRAFRKVLSGSLTDVSIGYRYGPKAFVDIRAGQSARVKGRTFKAGDVTMRIVTEWDLMETSLVPIGADSAAKLRSQEPAKATAGTEVYATGGDGLQPARGTTNRSKSAMNKWLRRYLEQCGMRADATDPEALEFLAGLTGEERDIADGLRGRSAEGGTDEHGRAQTDTEEGVAWPGSRTERRVLPAPPALTAAVVLESQGLSADLAAAESRGAIAERRRAADIRARAPESVPSTVVDQAITDGLSVEQACMRFLNHIQTSRPAAARVEVIGEGSDGMRAVLTDYICERAGVPVTEPRRQREVAEFRGIGLRDLAMLSMRADGQRVQFFSPAVATRAISSVSFANILSDSANKILAKAYVERPGTFRRWAGRRSVKDFKTTKDIGMSSFSSLVELGAGGELKHGTMGDKYESYQAKTYGRRFAVTRDDIINDDLNIIMQAPQRMAATVARLIDDLGYAKLVENSGVGPAMSEDSYYLFDASNRGCGANYYAHATASSLDDTGMAKARLLLGSILGYPSDDEEDVYLNLTPRFLLVPNALVDAADRIINSRERMVAKAGTTDATTYAFTQNIYSGIAEVISEGRLDGATNGTTAWYLLADPAVQETLVLVNLLGNENPVLERKDPTDVLGIGWWLYYDVGVGAVDWRGAVRLKGAA